MVWLYLNRMVGQSHRTLALANLWIRCLRVLANEDLDVALGQRLRGSSCNRNVYLEYLK